MSKKSLSFKGYVFAESLIALSLMTLVIGGLLSANHFLFGKTVQLNNQLSMQRILYDEINYYEKYGEISSKMIQRNGKKYSLTVIQDGEKLVKVEICHEETSFVVERQ